MHGVRKRFGATQALDGVDIAVAAGEVLALIGENGAGKSTLMKVLSGAHAPDEGRMELDGQPFEPRHPADARRAGVSMIYQELSLALHLSGDGKYRTRRRANERTVRPPCGETRRRTVDGDDGTWAARTSPPRRPRWPALLWPSAATSWKSAGRWPWVHVMLVLDEPTSSLARNDIERLFELVRRLKSRGLAIIYISHFLEEVRSGLRPLHGACATVAASARECRRPRRTRKSSSFMVGRTVGELYPRSPRTPGAPLLTLENLAGLIKPSAASFTLHQGEVLGIAGIIGSGRTEWPARDFRPGADPRRANCR